MTGSEARVEVRLPLLPLQSGLLFELSDAPGEAYRNQTIVETDADVDVDVLERSFTVLVARHQALRTAFVRDASGTWWQEVHAQVAPRVRTVDLRGVVDAASRIDAEAQAERAQIVDLSGPGLVRLLVVAQDEKTTLVLTHHHLVVDGWSTAVLLEELLALVQANGDPKRAALDPAPRPSDVRRPPSHPLSEWCALIGEDGGHVLGENRSGQYKDVVRDLDGSTAGAAAKTAANLGVTLGVLIQAAWMIALAASVGREGIVVGTTVSGRDGLDGGPRLVGAYSETLPVALGWSVHDTGADIVRSLQANLTVAQELAGIPLAEVLRETGPAGRFDTGFVFENYPRTASNELFFAVRAHSRSSLPLTLVVEPTPVLSLRLEHDTAAVPEPDALLDRCVSVLRELVTDPHRRVEAFDILTAADAARTAALARPMERAARSTAGELLLQQAARTPAAIALDAAGMQVDYAALAARTRAAAVRLRSQRGRRVAVLYRADADVVAVVYGLWLAGAVVVFLDPELPRERRDLMLADARCELVVTSGRDAEAPGVIPTLVACDIVSAGDTDTMPRPPLAAAEAYVMFTSGSTGTPKAVSVTHAGLADLVAAQRELFRLGEGARVLQFAAPAFDGIVAELVVTLASGATLVLEPDRLRRMPGCALATLLRETRVSHVTVPSTALLAAENADAWAGLDTLILAGEAVPTDARARVPAHVRVCNAYGPAEVTVCATGAVLDDGPATIGFPILGVGALVLDRSLRPVVPGAVGELWLRGDHLALGYVNLPGRTALAFVADPTPDAEPGARLYRTGDRVRWTPTGLEYIGRADEQLKVRGQRIEPGEVEAILTESNAVRGAAVVINNAGRLVAHLVPAPGAADTCVALASARARERLTSAMQPELWAVHDEFPRTPGGKLDRAALRAVEGARRRVAIGDGRPRTRLEAQLCEIFAEALNAPADRTDDLFAAGGHSLTAVKVAARASDVLRTDVSVRDVFAAPTPAALAARLSSAHVDSPASTTPDTPARLTSAQARLYVQEALAPGAYNLPFAVRSAGRVNPARLRAAFARLIARHAALRTIVDPGSPDVLGTRVLDWVAPEDLPFSIRKTTADELHAVLAEEGGKPLRLDTELPVRAVVLDVSCADGSAETVFLIVVHHVACDAASVSILADEFPAALKGDLAVQPAVPAPRPDPRRIVPDEEWWAKRLESATFALSLPTDFHATAPGLARIVERRFPQALGDRIRAAARRVATTPFTVLHAAVGALLARHGGGSDMLLGTTVTTRDAAHTDAVGMFVETLPLRTTVDPAEGFARLLVRTDAADRDAHLHSAADVDQVMRGLPDAAGAAVRVTVDMVPRIGDAGESWEGWEPLDVAASLSTPARFPLSFFFSDQGAEGITVQLVHDSALFRRRTARALLERLERLLDAALRRPGTPLGALPMLSETERADLIARATGAPLDDAPPFVERLAASLRRHRSRVAVRDGNAGYTYDNLDRASAALAQALRARGIGAGDAVAFLYPQGWKSFVCIVGVLRCGAHYVPLPSDGDPGRIRDLIAQVSPSVVVTDRTDLVGDAVTLTLPAPASTVADWTTWRPEDPAYLLFTSGTTGRPKTVVVQRRALDAYLRWASDAYPEAAGEVLLHTPPTFDLTVTAQLTPLLLGGTITVADLLADDLGRLTRPDFMKATPSHLAIMNESAITATPRGRLVLGGEQLPLAALRRLWERSPETTITNDYGPTEATVNCVEAVYRATLPPVVDPVPIGSPLPGNTVFVLDERLGLVPEGVEGELWITGAGLARGYGDAPRTAVSFVANPYGPPGSRLYRTGDRGRWTAEDGIVLAGRTDRQVKLRGHRIELDEVEATLARVPGVASATVMPIMVGDDVILGAFVAAAADREPAVRTAVQALVSAARPGRYVFAPALPLTVHGKVDAAAVRSALARATAPAGNRVRAASSEIEQRVCATFGAVLAVPEYAPDQDFFESGGHSLLAVALARRLRQVLEIDVALSSVFNHPTPAGFTTTLDIARDEDLALITDDLAQLIEADVSDGAGPAEGRDVLVTGATGFLGGEIVRTMLHSTDRHVAVIVRAADGNAAWERLRRRIGAEAESDRLTVLVGDLGLARFGLTDVEYDGLLRSVGAVVHAAADIGFLASYRHLRTANVVGTAHVAAFCASRGIALHHVSSLSVVGAANPDVPVIALPPLAELPANGYVRSKWVAEQIVDAFSKRGVRCVVYRPSRIVGHSETGMAPVHDALLGIGYAALSIGALPEDAARRAHELHADLVAVDRVAEAIVAGVVAEAPPGAYALVADRPTALGEIVAAIRRVRTVDDVPYPDWIAQLDRAAVDQPRFAPEVLFGEGWPLSASSRAQSETVPAAWLEASGFRETRVDAAQLERTFRRLLDEHPVQIGGHSTTAANGRAAVTRGE